jgi:hypothetical protein
LGADVDTDDVMERLIMTQPRPGRRMTLIESSEFASANACSQSSSVKSCVTMPREVSRPRSMRSMTIG